MPSSLRVPTLTLAAVAAAAATLVACSSAESTFPSLLLPTDGGSDAPTTQNTPDAGPATLDGGHPDADAAATSKLVRIANMRPGAPPIGVCFGVYSANIAWKRLDLPAHGGIPFGSISAPVAIPFGDSIQAVAASAPDCSAPIGLPMTVTDSTVAWDLVVLHGRDGNYLASGLLPNVFDSPDYGPEPDVVEGKVKLRIANAFEGHYTSAFPPPEDIGLVSGSTFTTLVTAYAGSYKVVMIDPIVNGSFGARYNEFNPTNPVGTGFTMNAGERWALFLVEHDDGSLAFSACRDDAPPVGGLEPCVMSP